MKSISFTALLACALLMTMGSLCSASRAMAQGSGSVASTQPQQEGAQDSGASSSVSGNWQLSWTAANGNQRQVTMQVKQDGSKLSGTFEGERGSAPLKGSLKGNQVSFSVKLPRRQASFTGTVDGNKMSGTTAEGASWTATRQ